MSLNELNLFKDYYYNTIIMSKSNIKDSVVIDLGEASQDLVQEDEQDEKNKVILSVDEVKLVLNIFDIVAKRGGFVPGDFKIVGELNDNLSAKLKSIN